jgi:hypothetical protein
MLNGPGPVWLWGIGFPDTRLQDGSIAGHSVLALLAQISFKAYLSSIGLEILGQVSDLVSQPSPLSS